MTDSKNKCSHLRSDFPSINIGLPNVTINKDCERVLFKPFSSLLVSFEVSELPRIERNKQGKYLYIVRIHGILPHPQMSLLMSIPLLSYPSSCRVGSESKIPYLHFYFVLLNSFFSPCFYSYTCSILIPLCSHQNLLCPTCAQLHTAPCLHLATFLASLCYVPCLHPTMPLALHSTSMPPASLPPCHHL